MSAAIMSSAMAARAAPFAPHSSVVARRRLPCLPLRAASPAATDFTQAPSSRSAIRKYLKSAGWEEAWVDGVINEVAKNSLHTSVAQIEGILAYLQGDLNIPLHRVENLVSLCKGVLARSPEQVRAVGEWLQSKGVAGPNLVALLAQYPTVLTYDVAHDGACLVSGAARASLVFREAGGRRFAGVTLWREGTSFGSAPVAPANPGH